MASHSQAKRERAGFQAGAAEEEATSLTFAAELLPKLRPLCDSLSVALLFWDPRTRQAVKIGSPDAMGAIERSLGAAGDEMSLTLSLAEILEQPASQADLLERHPLGDGGPVVFVQAVSGPRSEPCGALVAAGPPSTRAYLSSLLDLMRAAFHEHCRARLLESSHREAIDILGRAVLSAERAVLLVDSRLKVKLMSPAALRLLGLKPQDLNSELDPLLQLQPRELRWYCDGRVRRRQELVATVPAGELRITADFYPVSFDSREPFGTLLCIECLPDPTAINPARSRAYGLAAILGNSTEITRAKRSAVAASKTSGNVLIEGPMGSGKGLFARVIHCESSRRDGPFVVFDCSAVPSDSFDAQLFGRVTGPLTSSAPTGPGALEMACGGTLYLSNIDAMPEPTQYRLNESIRGGEFARIGSDSPLPLNARMIASTSCSLSEKVQSGAFRGDLYYQLNVTRIRLPALQERLGDLPEMCRHLCEEISSKEELHIKGISPQVLSLFMKYDWPGNLDELREVLKAACISCEKGIVREEHLLSQMRARLSDKVAPFASDPLAQERKNLQDSERILYQRALEITSWNVSQAAKLLGLSRASLYRKLSKVRIRRM